MMLSHLGDLVTRAYDIATSCVWLTNSSECQSVRCHLIRTTHHLTRMTKQLFLSHTVDLLTHCGRVTQYGDGSMLCKTLYFSLWMNSLKFKILWFFESRHHHLLESIANITHFYIFDSSWGVILTKKSKKIHFFKGCGEKMTITRLMIELTPWNYFHSIENNILVKIKPKRDTRLQKKNRAEVDFFATVVKIPAFFFNFLA